MAVFVLAICNVSITGKVRNQHFPPDVSAPGSAEINSFSEKNYMLILALMYSCKQGKYAPVAQRMITHFVLLNLICNWSTGK